MSRAGPLSIGKTLAVRFDGACEPRRAVAREPLRRLGIPAFQGVVIAERSWRVRFED
jgi:hypothetical protein